MNIYIVSITTHTKGDSIRISHDEYFLYDFDAKQYLLTEYKNIYHDIPFVKFMQFDCKHDTFIIKYDKTTISGEYRVQAVHA